MVSATIQNERLPDVVLGRDRTFARDQAIAQLGDSAHPDRESLLARVLENTYEPRRFRVAAAISLGRSATPAAEEVLLRNLPKTSDDAFPEVLRSLGRIGGLAALEAIKSLSLAPVHPDAYVAAYASTLIAHRFGLSGHELPFPPAKDLLEVPTQETRPIDLDVAEPATAQAVLEALKYRPYGIEFDPSALTRTRCAGEINVVCTNREFLGAAVERLARQKAILALAALQSPETGRYVASYVVLSRPSDEGTVAIMVHRCSGKLALAGTARVIDNSLEFELRAVRHPGARAISVKGILRDGRFQIGEALASTTPERRRVLSRHPR